MDPQGWILRAGSGRWPEIRLQRSGRPRLMKSVTKHRACSPQNGGKHRRKGPRAPHSHRAPAPASDMALASRRPADFSQRASVQLPSFVTLPFLRSTRIQLLDPTGSVPQ